MVVDDDIQEFPVAPEQLRAQLLARVDSVAPIILAHKSWSEAHARLSDAVTKALIQQRLINLYLPRALGGLEVDPVTCALVVEAVAKLDTAAGWFLMVANAPRLAASTWSGALVEKLWGKNSDLIVAASGNQFLRGQLNPNGYLLSGRIPFVSGCHQAEFLMAPVELQDGKRAMALVPMSQCQIEDNWQVLGMRGTGSNDVCLKEVVIPQDQLAPMRGSDSTRNTWYQGPLYRCPGRVLFATYVPVCLALAHQALNELSHLAQSKVPYASDSKLKHRQIAQVKYAQALATYQSARCWFMQQLEVTYERALHHVEATAQDKAQLYLAGTHAVQSCAQVVRWVADAAGTSAIYQESPLERAVRDMEVLRHHGFVSESRYASVAQLLWDSELDYPLILN